MYTRGRSHVLFIGDEWAQNVISYSRPLKARAELVVQMLVSALSLEPVGKKRERDDQEFIACALRCQKSEAAFEKMADLLDWQLRQLDAEPSLKVFGVAYGVLRNEWEEWPTKPQSITPVDKAKLHKLLAKVDLTLGDEAKLRTQTGFSKFSIAHRASKLSDLIVKEKSQLETCIQMEHDLDQIGEEGEEDEEGEQDENESRGEGTDNSRKRSGASRPRTSSRPGSRIGSATMPAPTGGSRPSSSTSRPASRPGSQVGSRPASRPASRPGSRPGSSPGSKKHSSARRTTATGKTAGVAEHSENDNTGVGLFSLLLSART